MQPLLCSLALQQRGLVTSQEEFRDIPPKLGGSGAAWRVSAVPAAPHQAEVLLSAGSQQATRFQDMSDDGGRACTPLGRWPCLGGMGTLDAQHKTR